VEYGFAELPRAFQEALDEDAVLNHKGWVSLPKNLCNSANIDFRRHIGPALETFDKLVVEWPKHRIKKLSAALSEQQAFAGRHPARYLPECHAKIQRLPESQRHVRIGSMVARPVMPVLVVCSTVHAVHEKLGNAQRVRLRYDGKKSLYPIAVQLGE